MEINKISPGSLLIAHPLMKPNLFAKSVVVMIETHKPLYKGLIVNKKGPYVVKDVIEECADSISESSPLYKGGPVNPSALIMLHTNDWYSLNTMQLGKEIAISSDSTMVEKLSVNNTPFNYKIIAGISQWSELQLRNELSLADNHGPYWLLLENYNINLLFDTDPDNIWEMAISYYSQNMYNQYF